MSYEYQIIIDSAEKDKIFLKVKAALLREDTLQCSFNKEKAIGFYFTDVLSHKDWGCDFELFFQENNLYFTCYAGNHGKVERMIKNALDILNVSSCFEEI